VAPAQVGAIEMLTHSRLLTVGSDALLVEVAALLSGAQTSVVVVCDDAGTAIGTVTETLLVRRLGLGQADFFTTRAGDVMTHEMTTCKAEDLLSEVLAMMHKRGLIHVLVVDAGNRPLGVLNARDGLRASLQPTLCVVVAPADLLGRVKPLRDDLEHVVRVEAAAQSLKLSSSTGSAPRCCCFLGSSRDARASLRPMSG